MPKSSDNKNECGNEERILIAALKLFSKKGYAGTSIREIVQEAEVTNPMIYYYFGNKEGLFHGLLDILLAHFHGQIRDVISAATEIDQLVEGCVRTVFGIFRESPEAYQFVYAVLFGPPGSFPEHDMFSEHDQFEAHLNQRFTELCPDIDRNPYWIRFLFGLIESVTFDALRRFSELPEEERPAFLATIFDDDVVNDITTFFLKGIGRK